MMFVPYRKHAYGPQWRLMIFTLPLYIWCSYLTGNTPMGLHGLLWRSLLYLYIYIYIYIYMMLVPHRKHIYGPPWPVMVIFTLPLYIYDVLPYRKHAYGPQWRLMVIFTLPLYIWCSYLTGNTPMGLHAYYGDLYFTFIYIYDVSTSQETHLWASMAYYGDLYFTFIYIYIYIYDVCTSQETHMGLHGLLWWSLLYLYIYVMFEPHRKHTYGPPWPVMVIFTLPFTAYTVNKHRARKANQSKAKQILLCCVI
jgi:hypothetical protein